MSRHVIHISLSPNLQRDDLLIAVKILLSPWRWLERSAQATVHKQLNLLFPGASISLTSSGRSALYQTLKALNIGPGDEVIIQAFTCIAVSATVKWTGATPRYADIMPQTYNLDPASVRRAISPRTRAIIIQHTFGIPAALEQLKSIADKHNLILIEDLAHSIGSSYRGKPLGTFGDIAVASFGRDKVLSCVFGGAIIVNNPIYTKVIKQALTGLTNPPLWWSLQQLMHPLITTCSLYLYRLGIGKIILYVSQKFHLISLAVSAQEKRGGQPAFVAWSLSPLLAPLLINQLHKLNLYQEHRRQLCRYYKSCLPPSQSPDSNNLSLLRYPIRVMDKSYVLKHYQARGIILGDWYLQVVTPCADQCQSVTGYQPGSCPQAEQATKETINLPTHINLLTSDAQRIIEILSRHKITTSQPSS